MCRCCSALLSTLVSLALLSSAAFADLTVESLLPLEGTTGTVIEMQVMGDLGAGKPKLWFTRSDDGSPKPKKTKLKVAELEDLGGGLTGLSVFFKKTKTGPGLYDLHIKPKGKLLDEKVFKGAFVMRAPVVDGLVPGTATSKALVMITGSFFGGPKKPKVFLLPESGGKQKKAKVQLVTDGNLLMVKLPKLADELYDVVVQTKVGSGTLEEALTVDNGGGGGGGPAAETFSMSLASVEQNLLLSQFDAGPNELGSVVMAFNASTGQIDICILTAGVLVGTDSFGISMAIPFNPGVTPTPFTVNMGPSPPLFNIVASQTQPNANWGDGGLVPGSITVTSASASRITGTFQLTLAPESPNPAAGDLQVTQGAFDISVQQ